MGMNVSEQMNASIGAGCKHMTAALEAQALAAADSLDEEHDATYLFRDKLRLVLALAWLEGYGSGMAEGKVIAKLTLEQLRERLAS